MTWLEIVEQNSSILIAAVSFLILAVSIHHDRRRFRNAIFLQVFMICAVCALLFTIQDTTITAVLGIVLTCIIIFLIFVVPILLIFNGFVMVKREGASLSNLVALLFGVVILIGVFAAVNIVATTDLYYNNRTLFLLLFLFAFLVFYVSMVFLAFMFYGFLIRLIPKKANYDYVIVLGAGLLHGNQVSRLLGSRIDKGIKVYKRSYTACKLLMSGGQGSDETTSEAQAMKDYAIAKGIDPTDILIEDESTDTMANLRNCQKIIQKRKGRQITAVVTSQYHVLRANIYAHALNFDMTGIGAHTALYYWPAAITREYAGMVKYYFLPYALFYLLFALIFSFIILEA